MIKERIDKLINTRNVEEVQWDSQVIVVSWWDSEMSLKERTISATCSEYGTSNRYTRRCRIFLKN